MSVQKLDPNVWFHNVKVAAAKVIGRETVQYVNNIYKCNIAYRMITGQEEKKAADERKIMMPSKGIIQIGGKRTEVPSEDIRRLKLILDELGIMHIIDDVTFCRAYDATEVAEESQSREFCSVKVGGKLSHNYSSVQLRHLEFRELIIPDFFIIDFISLTQLDNDEAGFFGNLIYDTEF